MLIVNVGINARAARYRQGAKSSSSAFAHGVSPAFNANKRGALPTRICALPHSARGARRRAHLAGRRLNRTAPRNNVLRCAQRRHMGARASAAVAPYQTGSAEVRAPYVRSAMTVSIASGEKIVALNKGV